MGQDTNNQDMSSTYQTTDHAAMNQVWNTLDTQSWSETTSFQSKTGEYIELHFEGEQSGWYVISSDNFAYFSLEDGPDLPQDSPLGFVHPGDKSYSIPAGVYNAVSKLLKNYTDQHPPAYNLFDVLKDALTAKDTFIQVPGYSKPLNVHDHPANELLNLYMNAFGDLNKWAPLSKNDIGDFNEAGTDYVAIIHDYVSSHTEITFSLKSNLVCVSVLGITHWYSVPSSVMTNVLNVSEKEIK
jgi:hypothetical protein